MASYENLAEGLVSHLKKEAVKWLQENAADIDWPTTVSLLILCPIEVSGQAFKEYHAKPSPNEYRAIVETFISENETELVR